MGSSRRSGRSAPIRTGAARRDVLAIGDGFALGAAGWVVIEIENVCIDDAAKAVACIVIDDAECIAARGDEVETKPVHAREFGNCTELRDIDSADPIHLVWQREAEFGPAILDEFLEFSVGIGAICDAADADGEGDFSRDHTGVQHVDVRDGALERNLHDFAIAFRIVRVEGDVEDLHVFNAREIVEELGRERGPVGIDGEFGVREKAIGFAHDIDDALVQEWLVDAREVNAEGSGCGNICQIIEHFGDEFIAHALAFAIHGGIGAEVTLGVAACQCFHADEHWVVKILLAKVEQPVGVVLLRGSLWAIKLPNGMGIDR